MSDEPFTRLIRRVCEFIHAHAVGVLSSPAGESAKFEDLARDIFAAQFEAVPPYQALCRARGVTPANLADYRDIPAVPTTAFKEFEFSSLARAERTRVFHSSGTTGQAPSRHFHSPESLALYAESLRAGFARHLLPEIGHDPPRGALHEPTLTPALSRPTGEGARLVRRSSQSEGGRAGEGKSGRFMATERVRKEQGTSRDRTWRFLILAPPATEGPHSSLAYMFTHLAETWGGSKTDFLATGDAAGRWHLDGERAREALASAARGNTPVVLLGTAFMFVHLLDDLEERSASGPAPATAVEAMPRDHELGEAPLTRPPGTLSHRMGEGWGEGEFMGSLALPPGSRILETGGYKGRSREVSRNDLYAALTHTLGVPASHLVSEYGMSELGSQAYDQVVPDPDAPTAPKDVTEDMPARRFRFPPWACAWVVSPEDGLEVGDGGVGLLRILDLANVRSVMAVQTEDLAVRRGEGFELLGRLPRAQAKGCSLLATWNV